MTTAASPDEPVLWDVIEEHLAEAAFLFEQVERAYDSPVITLDTLETGIEARLEAHLDALVVGGTAVHGRAIAPRLHEPDPEALEGLSAAALTAATRGALQAVVPALAHADAGVRDAAVRAVSWAGGERAWPWIQKRLEVTGSPFERASLFRVCASIGCRLSPLIEWLQDDDPMLALAAASATLHCDPSKHRPIVEYLLECADTATRLALVIPALAWGVEHAWQRCAQLALDSRHVHPSAMALYAALGRPGDHERIVALLASPRHRRSALFALGLSGNVRVLEPILAHLEGPSALNRKLAAQAVDMITGQQVPALVPSPDAAPSEEDDEAQALPPIEIDDLDADLVPRAVDALPDPDPVAARKLGMEAATRLSPDRRWLAGEPYSPQSVLTYLARAPLGRRHALSLALFVRTGAEVWIDSRAPTKAQRAQLARAQQLVGLSRKSWGPW